MQTRLESFLESLFNVGSGFVTALPVWAYIVKPMFNIRVSGAENVVITSIFTVVSVARGYIWRRCFNYRALRKNKKNKEYLHAVTGDHR